MPVHSNSRTCRLGRRPVTQGPRNQSSNQGWTEKLATERKLRASKDILSVGTWNVRTLGLWAAGKLQLLQEEMRRYRCDILGISEMRLTQSDELEGGNTIWSWHEHNHKEGVGFILSNKAKRALLGYKPVNERILIARFQAQPFNIAAIQVYAPTSESSDEEIENFYNDLIETIKEVPTKDVIIIGGDWNAKIGIDNTGWEKVMGKFGYGSRNERGEKLLEFATECELMICNTIFQQKDCRKWTWRSFDGKSRNMIDMILIKNRWR